MKNVIFETGVIVEVGENRSYGNARFYSHIELMRADKTKVRLEDVAVSLIVTPKLLTPAVSLNLAEQEVSTIAFIHEKGQVLDRPAILGGKTMGQRYRNLILGYANPRTCGVERDGARWLTILAQVATVLLAALCAYIVFAGWWLILLVLPVLALIVAALSWKQFSDFQNALNLIRSRFTEMGYLDKTMTVYS